MRSVVLVISTSVLSYGVYLGAKSKITGQEMSDEEMSHSAIAMVIGIAGLALGYFKLKSK